MAFDEFDGSHGLDDDCRRGKAGFVHELLSMLACFTAEPQPGINSVSLSTRLILWVARLAAGSSGFDDGVNVVLSLMALIGV